MKYILIENQFGLPCAVMFSEAIQHSEMAKGKKVLGAGFCDNLGHVWGESVSLDIKSKPEDAKDLEIAIKLRV